MGRYYLGDIWFPHIYHLDVWCSIYKVISTLTPYEVTVLEIHNSFLGKTLGISVGGLEG